MVMKIYQKFSYQANYWLKDEKVNLSIRTSDGRPMTHMENMEAFQILYKIVTDLKQGMEESIQNLGEAKIIAITLESKRNL